MSGTSRIQQPTYGDIANATTVAALGVFCETGGHTGSSILANAFVVYRAHGKELRVVGIITPQIQPAGLPRTLLTITGIGQGKITVAEGWCLPTDPTAGPSGSATTTWDYVNGTLLAERKARDHRPARLRRYLRRDVRERTACGVQ